VYQHRRFYSRIDFARKRIRNMNKKMFLWSSYSENCYPYFRVPHYYFVC